MVQSLKLCLLPRREGAPCDCLYMLPPGLQGPVKRSGGYQTEDIPSRSTGSPQLHVTNGLPSDRPDCRVGCIHMGHIETARRYRRKCQKLNR